ncbi:MAG: lipoate--protein ligase [Gemmatales bacterium]|nr:MAG: lipoate--protein ligase [Gemmatales bacterium]
MATDEAQLEAAHRGIASLRFYTWHPATLSLGYFQSHRVRFADADLAALPFVRRPSGGLTLVHDRELTYALALPAGKAWGTHDGPGWLCRMHGIIGLALRQLGVCVDRVDCAGFASQDDILCFRHHTPGDLLLDGYKITGSAQRRQRGALLQHGAVLLAASRYATTLPGIADLAGKQIAPSELAQAIAQQWQQQISWLLEVADPLDVPHRLVEKYRSSAWNEKR